MTHPRCDLAKSRVRQAGAVLIALVATLAAVIVSLPIAAGVCAVVAGIAMAVSAVKSRWPIAALYPGVTLLLGMTFWTGLVTQLIGNRPRITWQTCRAADPGRRALQHLPPMMQTPFGDEPVRGAPVMAST